MIEKLQKDYSWLFTKKKARVVNGKREFYSVGFSPQIVDGGSHWAIYREENSSPLILSKNY